MGKKLGAEFPGTFWLVLGGCGSAVPAAGVVCEDPWAEKDWSDESEAVMGIIVMLIVGALAGWAAGNIMKGRGFGLLGNILVGIVGGVLGGFLLGLLGFAGEGVLAALITSVIGACALLFLVGLLRK